MVSDSSKKFFVFLEKKIYSGFFVFLIFFVFIRSWAEKRVLVLSKSLFASNVLAFFLTIAFYFAFSVAGLIDRAFVSLRFVRQNFSKKLKKMSSRIAHAIAFGGLKGAE